MDYASPTFSNLFAQLGLPADDLAIGHFIAAHSPMPQHQRLDQASFWNSSQSAFLREGLLEDGDWAEVVDQLNSCLHC